MQKVALDSCSKYSCRSLQEMLEHLKGIDVGFLHSIATMIASCRYICAMQTHSLSLVFYVYFYYQRDVIICVCSSVLDWNTYERYNKSEPVAGQGSDGNFFVVAFFFFCSSIFT